MTTGIEKLSVKEKVGYSLGDAAANFIFQTMLYLQLSFYTDTFGITAAQAGTLFLVMSVVSAVFDPIAGIIADRTNTRWGKFRPWVLWTALPFGVMGLVAFTTPGFSPGGKLFYAYASYTLLMLVYSANNVPYSALSGVMTGDIGERTSLSSYRFVFVMLAAFVIQVLAVPMYKYFGQGNNARGYQVTLGLLSAVGVAFFVITFLTTRERIQPDPGQKSSVGQDLADLVKNSPWVILFLTTVLYFMALSMRNSVMLYYFKYYVGNEELFSVFNTFGLAATIAGILAASPLSLRYGRRNIFNVGLLFTVIFTALFIVLPPAALAATYAMETIRSFAYGLTVPLLWAMMADVADYSEWKTGRRATAMVFAGVVFGLKAGLGLGRGLGGWLLSLYGYVANAPQTPDSLLGIRMTGSVFTAVFFGAGLVAMLFYVIDKALNIRITEELVERRKKYGVQPA